MLAGVRGLPALARRKVGVKPLLPREVDDKLVPPAWRKAVYANPDLPQGAVDRDAYVVCVLEQLHRALNNRDVFASPSHRWSNPRARLLDGADWDLEIGARTTRVGTKSFDLEHEIRARDGRLVAEVQTTLVAFDYDADSTMPIPPEWRARIENYESRSAAAT